MENSAKMTSRERAGTSGAMAESMRDSGRQIKCSVQEFSNGLMDESTREASRMIKRMVREF